MPWAVFVLHSKQTSSEKFFSQMNWCREVIEMNKISAAMPIGSLLMAEDIAADYRN